MQSRPWLHLRRWFQAMRANRRSVLCGAHGQSRVSRNRRRRKHPIDRCLPSHCVWSCRFFLRRLGVAQFQGSAHDPEPEVWAAPYGLSDAENGEALGGSRVS